MITTDKYCKVCGQQINISALANAFQKTFIKLDGEFYCLECGKEVVKKRRSKLK